MIQLRKTRFKNVLAAIVNEENFEEAKGQEFYGLEMGETRLKIKGTLVKMFSPKDSQHFMYDYYKRNPEAAKNSFVLNVNGKEVQFLGLYRKAQ